MENFLAQDLAASIEVKQAFARESLPLVAELARQVAAVLSAGGKLLVFGNGGSAADAQHLAAEFVNRFLMERRPLPALALTTDTSVLTSIGNDYGYGLVFVKQVQALGAPGDLALGISTSGTSPNVVSALDTARDMGLATAALIGGTDPDNDRMAELVLRVPSDHTPHIQECHLWIEHNLCGLVERILVEEGHA